MLIRQKMELTTFQKADLFKPYVGKSLGKCSISGTLMIQIGNIIEQREVKNAKFIASVESVNGREVILLLEKP